MQVRDEWRGGGIRPEVATFQRAQTNGKENRARPDRDYLQHLARLARQARLESGCAENLGGVSVLFLVVGNSDSGKLTATDSVLADCGDNFLFNVIVQQQAMAL